MSFEKQKCDEGRNRSTLPAEQTIRCGPRRTLNPASQILKFVSEFSSEFIFPLLMSVRGNYFWSKLKKSRVFFSIGPDSDIFIRKVLSCRLKCWRITLCMNVWRKNSFNKLYIIKKQKSNENFSSSYLTLVVSRSLGGIFGIFQIWTEEFFSTWVGVWCWHEPFVWWKCVKQHLYKLFWIEAYVKMYVYWLSHCGLLQLCMSFSWS